MKCTINIETEETEGVLQHVNDMMNINEYKRALWDIKTSIIAIFTETEDHEDMYNELENFIDVEMTEILRDLNLD